MKPLRLLGEERGAGCKAYDQTPIVSDQGCRQFAGRAQPENIQRYGNAGPRESTLMRVLIGLKQVADFNYARSHHGGLLR